MNPTSPVKYEQEVPKVLQAMAAIHPVIDTHGLDRKIAHLVHLRASQMNGCAHCIKMHLKEAREDGESNERLDRLVAWRHVHDFSEREKAALAWTEALTHVDDEADLASLRARLREHFTDKEIGALTCEIAMINMWNRINVSRH